MVIQLPNLDTKTYEEISEEMVASIPKYTDRWTNHNPSDPGITILEMLSWIAEATLYRMNRVPNESYVNFLRLVAGASGIDEIEKLLKDPHSDKCHRNVLEFLKEIEEGNEKPIPDIKREALLFLNSRYRAITEDDFCQLAAEATDMFGVEVRRVIVEKALDESKVEIILIPGEWKQYEELAESEKQSRYKELTGYVMDYLNPRTLIGTKIKVKQPVYSDVSIDLEIVCHQYAIAEKIEADTKNRILQHLDPFVGGDERTGWPYRRSLSIYEIAQVVEETEGVKQVESIVFDGNKKLKIKPINGLIKVDSLNVEVGKEEK
ncbi:hypothetical protein RE474_13520 [Methanolobus sediminis]|uniref:Baseplate protein J-like domain-containing protein n=1 Tax=Methanolobus sediminis TaxID=3072978 RepID=A0AA51UKR4_9EURY|nr:hypothetical protein [Methanolobus sediminis]WMW25082.1 hypothetical protein RE474_13520 [Methanolobus sediminis]